MKRVSGGYTWYFNHKYARNGSLFQGVFKSIHIDTNEYLLWLSVYVNCNNILHSSSGETAGRMCKSSYEEYTQEKLHNGLVYTKNINACLCSKDIVLNQFSSGKQYMEYCEKTLPLLKVNKLKKKELAVIMLES